MKNIIKLLTLTFLLSGTSVFAADDFFVEKEDFLRKVEKGLVTFKREAAIPTKQLDPNPVKAKEALKVFFDVNQKRYPITFHPDFFYIPTVRTKLYSYQVSYDWTQGECYYTFMSEKFVEDSKKLSDQLVRSNNDMSTVDQNLLNSLMKNNVDKKDFQQDKIDMKYCDKVFAPRKIKRYKPKAITVPKPKMKR